NLESYAARARDFGIAEHITFTGRVDYDRAQEYLGLGDLAVSAKLSSTEANGKLYNYMACGLATVVFDTPVNREILGELGVYARLGDAASLAARIVELLAAPGERAERGRALRERAVADYSWDRSGAQMETIYRDLLSGR